MKIEPTVITVRDLAEGYEDNHELGVRAFGGKLDVRPPYQREFVYKDKQRDNPVMQTIAGRLEAGDIAALAAYFRTQK